MHDTRALAAGYGLAFFGIISLAAATVCTQVVHANIPLTQIILGQSVSRIFLAVPVLIKDRSLPTVQYDKLTALGAVLVLKSLTYAFYLAPKLAPAGTVQAMFNTAGMITCIVRDIVKSRGCSVTFALPLMFCIAGLLMTLQPTFLGFINVKEAPSVYISPCCLNNTSAFNYTLETNLNISLGVYDLPQRNEIPIGYAVSFIAGVFRGLAYITTVDQLDAIEPNTLNFWIGTFNTISSALGLLIFQSPVSPNTSVCWVLLLGIGLGDALGATLLNFAVMIIYPTAVTIVLTLDIVIVAVFQFTILRDIHRGHENWEEYFGLTILILANVLHPLLTWKYKTTEGYVNIGGGTQNEQQLLKVK